MRLEPPHFDHLQRAIATAVDQLGTAVLQQHVARLQNDPCIGDAAKRFRWDLMRAAGVSAWLCAHVYSYANDAHIDTALRRIVSSVLPPGLQP